MSFENAKLLIDLGAADALAVELNRRPDFARRPFLAYGPDAPLAVTPLTWTARSLRKRRIAPSVAVAIAETLLSRGADVDALDGEGETPLSAATAPECGALAKWLLGRGADPARLTLHRANFGGWLEGGTALHWAAARGGVSAVRALLAAGADPSARCPELGATPLYWAAQSLTIARPDIESRLMSSIEHLLAAGADGGACTIHGDSALDMLRAAETRTASARLLALTDLAARSSV